MSAAALLGLLGLLAAAAAAAELRAELRRRKARRLLERLPGPVPTRSARQAAARGLPVPGIARPLAALLVGSAVGAVLASPLAGAAAALGAALLPPGLRRLRARRRREAFQAALPGALELVARALRAGQPLDAALLEAARSGPAPVAAAFGRVREDLALGAPFDVALRRLAAREPEVPEVHLLVSALLLGRETGGQLADVLDRLARTVRRRIAFRRELAALLAEGRATAWVLGSLPVAFLLGMAWLRPGHLEAWLADPAGRALLGIAVLLELAGFACMRLLTRVEP